METVAMEKKRTEVRNHWTQDISPHLETHNSNQTELSV